MFIEMLHRFSAGSMNDESHRHLWFKGVSLFIDQLNAVLKYTGYVPQILDMSRFENPESAKLEAVFKKNKSDKSRDHNYHILYSYIFDALAREKPLNILEIGMGTNNPHIVSSMGMGARPGASLYAWSEYLPNARIYGADIDSEILFDDGRIKTHQVDQLNQETFKAMHESFGVGEGGYDLIIDDGLHSIGANLNTLLFALKHVKVGGWIVIEDVCSRYVDNWFVIDYMLKQNPAYKVDIVKANSTHVFLVRKLH